MGPLIGGVITTTITWRAAFIFQALVIVVILVMARRLVDPVPPDPTRPFDVVGAVLSAAGLVILVGGIMAADQSLALMAGLIVLGALVLVGFFLWIRRREREGREALLSTSLFHNRTSNLALVTQNMQWSVLLGTSFTVAAYLQVVRHYDAIQTGVIFTAATVGILLTSLAARPLAKRFRQRALIGTGFVVTLVGIVVLLVLVKGHPGAVVLRARSVLDRDWPRAHAHPVGQRRAVVVPRTPAGRDLWALTQRVEPRLVAGHRGGRHHPCRRTR